MASEHWLADCKGGKECKARDCSRKGKARRVCLRTQGRKAVFHSGREMKTLYHLEPNWNPSVKLELVNSIEVYLEA